MATTTNDTGDNSAEVRESETMREVRRWRKAVYEERQRMTPEERRKDDEQTLTLARKLGLRVLDPEELARPRTTKKAD